MSQLKLKPTIVPALDPALYCNAYRDAMGRYGVLDPEKLFAAVGEQNFKPIYFRIEALIEVLKQIEFTPELIPASATCRLSFATLKFRVKDLVKEAGKYKSASPDSAPQST
jgi:hypothetical protein